MPKRLYLPYMSDSHYSRVQPLDMLPHSIFRILDLYISDCGGVRELRRRMVDCYHKAKMEDSCYTPAVRARFRKTGHVINLALSLSEWWRRRCCIECSLSSFRDYESTPIVRRRINQALRLMWNLERVAF